MNFAELRFWEYLLAALVVVLGMRRLLAGRPDAQRTTFDKLGLLSIGLFLLLCVSWVTFVIFLIVALTTYAGLSWILRYHARHAFRYLALLIPLQLMPLLYYKYADFVANRVFGGNFDSLHQLVIPVGISFYTFQKVAFVVDTLAFKQPLPRFLDYMNFAGFFPQIVAGPIERRQDLLPQMESFRWRWLPKEIDEGAGWIVVGLFFKCCLADNLASFFSRSSTTNPYLIWMANGVFGLRIYYDFAGYSLVALGLARCLGIRLTLNFISPYCSTSIVEFWRRWHVTLSQWFRDYLYVPLGGGRVKWWMWNVALVFVVSGIWHGAGWNFVLWGALHAAFLIIGRLSGKLRPPAALGWMLTMLAAFFAWLCFYELDGSALLMKIRTLATPTAYKLDALHAAGQTFNPRDGFFFAMVVMLVGAALAAEWLSIRRRNAPYCYLLERPVQMALVVLTLLMAPGKNNGFIYFAF